MQADLDRSEQCTLISWLRARILYLSEIHKEWNIHKSVICSICIHLFSFLVILSSDDEDGPSEPQCTELMQDSITESKETDQQSDFCFSEKQLENKMKSHTEQVVQLLAYVLLCQLISVMFVIENVCLLWSQPQAEAAVIYFTDRILDSLVLKLGCFCCTQCISYFENKHLEILNFRKQEDHIVTWGRNRHDKDTSVEKFVFTQFYIDRGFFLSSNPLMSFRAYRSSGSLLTADRDKVKFPFLSG